MPNSVVERAQARPVPNLIQGVSQQTPELRRDPQCEAQQDCINSPRLGVWARNGGDVLATFRGLSVTDAFCYELVRGSAEHYLMVLSNGTLRVIDLVSGVLCSVTNNITDGYLASAPGVKDVDNFRVQSVGDHTFIVNRSVVAQMLASSASPVRPPEAMVFFEAGNYSTTYVITIEYAGTLYTWTYVTPDNSISGNAAYIATNQIAATFFYALTGTSAATFAGIPGGVGSGGITGVAPGGSYSGGAGPGKSTGPTTATSLGFSVAIEGNLIRIWRANDSNPFTLDCTDGSGDQAINALQSQIQSFSNLPRGGFEGMAFEISGVNTNGASADYFVAYSANTKAGGSWLETVAPDTPTQLDPTTMPHDIFCEAVDTFLAQPVTWQLRIAGDGVNSALNPGYVGKQIKWLGYYEQRLAAVTQSTCDFSKSANVYTWFPDTVQATLDTAPISLTLAADNTTALMSSGVVVDESLILWAQLAQFRVNAGGINALTPTTVQSPQSTVYEFAENANFAKVGTSVYFAYESDSFATIFNLQYQTGRAIGDTEVTAHVQEYIPAGVRRLAVSAPLRMIFVGTDGAPNQLFLYNFLNQGDTVEQSAWSLWNMPDGTIIWHSVYKQLLMVLLQRTDGLYLLTFPLNSATVDPGGNYQTRLDMRVPESSCTVTYNAVTRQSVIMLPYSVGVDEQPLLRVVIRTTVAGHGIRGKVCAVLATSANSVTVQGDMRGAQFYAGLRIYSSREESQFYLRTQTGSIPTDKLNIKNFVLNYYQSAYTRIEVVQGSQEQTKTQELFPIAPGYAEPQAGLPPALGSGALRVPVDSEALETTITVINDSPFPSRWSSASYEFIAVERFAPMLTPYGGPVQ